MKSAARPVTANKILLPTLAAVGGSLAAGSAAALELGELKLHSTLGQPLRASIAYAVGPNEQIDDYCVSVRAGQAANGLPAVTRAHVRIANGIISLSGTTPMSEPLMTTRVVVNCPYTPRLSREYLIFVDPPGFVADAVSENPGKPEAPSLPLAPAAPLPEAPPAVTATPRRASIATPIPSSSRYRVRPGDSLSAIVQRLENRQVKLWDAIYAVFDANPDAFIDADLNKLKAGSWLVIPDNAITNAIATSIATSIATDARIDAPIVAEHDARNDAPIVTEYYARTEAPVVARYADVQPDVTAADAPVIEAKTGSETISETSSDPIVETTSEPDYSTLRPGDIILESDSQFVSAENSAANEAVVIPDTEFNETILTVTPNVPVAASAVVVVEEPSKSSWISWLIGSVIALFAGFLLFGRKLRERFVSRPIGAAQQRPSRRSTDQHAQADRAFVDVDYDIADDSPTQENFILDADLIAGIGLERGTEMDINQDFGFAVTTEIDLELPERAALDDEPPSTDILPPMRSEIESILESEVLPEDDDYDMSVVVDVTKIRSVDDVTSRDLQAIAVESDDEILETDDYTISQETDYDIVEDDFEEQLTATQALSDEIEKAAAELAKSIDEEEHAEDEDSDSGESTAVQLGSISELDVTVNLPAENDVISDLEDTAINEALIILDIPIDDKTVEMPSADDELTVEMPMESENLDKKAG